MKKLVALMVALTLLLICAMAFVSCGDDPCTKHVDANSDGLCDECGATVETGKNPPEDPTDPEDPVNPPPGTGDPEGCTHDIVTVGEKAPTCTEAGYNAHEYCTKCTYTTKVEVAALDHDLKSEAAKASTCAEVGWNAYEYCSRCDYTTKVELPLGAHTTAVIPGTDATCVSLGATPKVYCSVCQCVFVESVEIPFASHDYGDGFECTVCKAEVASLGLEYTLSSDKTYYKVKGMGGCTDTLLAIPAVHEGLPVKEIGYEAFKDKTFVSGVIIPESITRIDGSAFSGCTGIENIYFNAVDCTMGAGTSTISVFQNVGKNTDGVTVHIGAKVKKIPSYFLYAYGANTAANVTSVVYSEDGVLESIGYKAFECVQSLKAITIPETVKSISSNAFRNCSLQAVYYKAVDATATSGIFDSASGSGGIVLFVGKDVKKIPDNFMNASSDSYVPSVSEIVFESGSVCEYIGKFAFQKIKKLDSLVLPPSMKELGQRAFSYMPSLSSVTLNEGFIKLGSYAFADNGVTLSVSFPNSIKEFGDWEFENTTLADEIFTVYGNCKYIGNENNPYAVLYGVNVTDTLTKENISEVTIHADTKAIYPSAFQGCKALESVVVPDGVKSLGSYAFAGCSALKSVTLGSGVTDILMYTFNGCKLLDTLTVKGELTSIAAYAFNNCAALGEFTVPATVENIAAGAFYGCSSLETVSGMAGVKTIGANAFYNCASLVTVSIPDGIESIGTSAFAGCTALNYHVEGGVKYLGNAKNPAIILVSAESKSTITSADIPETTRIILSSAFVSASNLKTVTGGEGVIYIGEAAFSSCSALETIPAFESLTYIGQNAFNVCSSLKAINIGENVSYIGNQAFRYCKAVTEIKFSARNLLDSPGYYGTAGMYETAFHSVGQNGEGVAVTIGKSATRLPAYIFAGHTNESDSYHVNVKSVTFEAESSCTEIGTYAFEYVSSFSTIDIPASVKTIGAGAFGDCSGLVTVTGMGGVETIGSSAFSWCSSLESVSLSNKLTSLGSYAFSGCSKLASANLPESLTSIPQSAFSNCSSLTAITIPSGVTSIGSYAFSNCKSLTSITYNAKNVPDFEDENYVFNNAGQNGAGIALTIGKDVKVVPAYLFNP